MSVAAVKFNRDKVLLDVRDSVASVDFHIKDSPAVTPKSWQRLDGRSTDCLVTYKSDQRLKPETFTVIDSGKMTFPDDVDVTIHGPDKYEDSDDHYLWGTASDGTKDFKAVWTLASND